MVVIFREFNQPLQHPQQPVQRVAHTLESPFPFHALHLAIFTACDFPLEAHQNMASIVVGAGGKTEGKLRVYGMENRFSVLCIS